MKVLVADKLPASALDQLQAAGFAVSSRPGLAGDGLRAEVQTLNPEVLIVRSTRVTADVLAAGAALGLVVRAGAGTNTIDVGAASDQGIYVANCPGKNAAAGTCRNLVGASIALEF